MTKVTLTDGDIHYLNATPIDGELTLKDKGVTLLSASTNKSASGHRVVNFMFDRKGTTLVMNLRTENDTLLKSLESESEELVTSACLDALKSTFCRIENNELLRKFIIAVDNKKENRVDVQPVVNRPTNKPDFSDLSEKPKKSTKNE